MRRATLLMVLAMDFWCSFVFVVFINSVLLCCVVTWRVVCRPAGAGDSVGGRGELFHIVTIHPNPNSKPFLPNNRVCVLILFARTFTQVNCPPEDSRSCCPYFG